MVLTYPLMPWVCQVHLVLPSESLLGPKLKIYVETIYFEPLLLFGHFFLQIILLTFSKSGSVPLGSFQ